MPPSVEELRRRLETRNTDSQEMINERVGKAQYEIGFAPQYDCRIVNDDLEIAINQTRTTILNFINK